MTRLFEFLIIQEKKYEKKLSSYGNFYCRHIMVQQFLSIQLKTHLKITCCNLFMGIAQSFGKKQDMA